LVSVKPRILNGVAPEFDILLRVTNPNRSALDIAGLSYNIYLVGNKVIEGVANDLPEIPAYGEADVKLSATADLFGSLQVLSGLLADPTSPVEFEFNAEIDVGTFYPMINVNRSGVISLQ
ncbi:MAG: LEA type 2 family protein, partial [Gammaproteobacteria bacterium]|nr:LEA type 2 family protein [Gammaproteobacteria bacterium]